MKCKASALTLGDTYWFSPSAERGYTAKQIRDLSQWVTITKLERDGQSITITTPEWVTLAHTTDTFEVKNV